MSTSFPQATENTLWTRLGKNGKNFGVNSLDNLAILYKVNIKFCNTCEDNTGEDTYMVCWLHDMCSQFRSGYIARDQNLARSSSFQDWK